MLCRLADQLSELEGTIKKSQQENQKQEEQLSSLRPTLEKLKQATQPVQKFFSMPLDWEKDQHTLALLLPPLVINIFAVHSAIVLQTFIRALCDLRTRGKSGTRVEAAADELEEATSGNTSTGSYC